MNLLVLENTYDLLKAKLQNWLEDLILMLPNLVTAIIIVLIFLLLGRLTKSALAKLFERFSANPSIATIISAFFGFIVSVTGLFIALGVLQLEKTVTSLLAGAGIVGLALSFAFQDLASNYVGGILIAFNRPVAVGDLIEIKEYLGTVEKTNLRTVQIRTLTGQRVLIPAKFVIQEPLINYTTNGIRRMDLIVRVSYGEDLRRVKKIVTEALGPLSFRNKNTDVELFWESFDDSSVNFYVRVWLNRTDQKYFLGARSEAIMVIHETFKKEGITIPFPIRTLDFGIKGGEKLEDIVIKNKTVTEI